MIDFAEIRARLIDNISSIVPELVPGGRRNGKYWIGRNPTRADRHGGSFWVLMSGPATGAWRDEAGVRGVDEGDIVRLVQYCRRLADLSETRKECLKLLGLSDSGGQALSAREIAKRNAERDAARARQEKAEAETRARNARGAFALWLKATTLSPASFRGSVLERYLLGRAIDLSTHLIDVKRPLPGALRLFAVHDYTTADGELIELPCMAALMSGPDGKPRAIHRTWLAPDGSGKAVLPEPRTNKPRKIWPAGWQGSVIRLAKGAGNLTPEEAGRQGRRGPLIVTEGIEDGLACMLAMPDYRVWAAGTLGNIGHVPMLPCISQLTVCADNDWNKPEAVAAFDKAIAMLKGHGVPIRVARSPRGKDMNDLLKGETI